MANLTPELLALLRQQDAQTYNKMTGGAQLNGGQYYQPQYAGGGGGGEGGLNDPGTLAGYTGYDQSWGDGGKHQGEKGQFYNADGSFSNEFDWKDDDAKKNLMLALAAAGGMAFLPGGALSSTFGQGTMAAQAGLEGAASGAAGGAAGVEGVTGLNYMNGSDLMSDAFVANGGYGSGGFGGTSGGYLDNLFNGAGPLSSRVMGGTGAADAATTASTAASEAAKATGAKNPLLGLGATLLGAASGAKGVDKTETASKTMDPRLAPYVFGANGNPGLLGYTQQMLDRQMAPGALQGYDDMRRVGQGLLAQSVAGNGFAKFFPGR